MPPQQNAAATARLYLARQYQAGEARTSNMMETSLDSARSYECASTAVISQRLPSTRPIDQRWDRSRGIVFSRAKRPIPGDYTWSRGNSITFGPLSSHSKAYYIRSLGPQQPDRQRSMVNDPNRTPTFNVPPQNEQLAKLAQIEAGLRKENAELESRIAKQASQMAQSDAKLAQLRHQREGDIRAAQSRASELRAAVEDARRQEQQIHSKRVSAMNVEIKQVLRKATDEAEKARHLQEQMQALVTQHSRDLLGQKQRLDKQRAEELQAATRGRQVRKEVERSSYGTYRKVYDDLNDSLVQLSRSVVLVENARFKAAKVMEERPSYSAQMEKVHPWFKHLYPQLSERLDMYHREHTSSAEASGNAIKELRYAQQDLEGAFRMSAHASRALSRYHRINEEPNKLTMTAMVHWIANDQPFRVRRDEVDDEMKGLRRRIAQEKNEALRAHHQQDLDDLQAMRHAASKVLSVHSKIRDIKSLEALLTDSFAEKEVFAAVLKPTIQIEEAALMWQVLIGMDGPADEVNAVSFEEQRTFRRAYLDKALETRTSVREAETLVRRKALLRESLGQRSEEREREVDAIIRERITLKRVEERSAFARLGVARASRSSAFARTSRATSVGPPIRSILSISTGLRRPLSAPPPAARATGASNNSDGVREKREVELEIVKIKRSIVQMPEGKERKHAESHLVDLRREVSKHELARLEAKLAELLRTKPASLSIDRYARQIEKRMRVLAEAGAGQSDRDGHPPSKREVVYLRRRLRMQRQKPVGSAQAANTSEGGVGASTGFVTFKPTAARQAAHTFWPPGFRHFHAEGARPNLAAEDRDAPSKRVQSIDPIYFLPRGAERQGSELCFGDAESAQSLSAGLPSVQCSSKSLAAGQSDGQDGEHTTSAEGEHEPDAQSSQQSDAYVLSSPDQSDSASFAASTASDHSSADEQDGVDEQESDSDTEAEVALTYQIPAADYRNAVMASRNTSAAFWTYKLYKNSEGKTPTLHFCTNLKAAEEQAQKFLDEPVIGFDIEWEPKGYLKKENIKDNVSLIQIASEDKIGLFQIARFVGDTVEQLMPPSLRKVLESDQTIKAGVNIIGDARRLKQYLNVEMKGLFELSHLYKVVTFSETEPAKVNRALVSVAAQVQNVLLLPLKKDEVRTSAWAKALNLQQVEYSASDAYAGFRLFHALERKRLGMRPRPPRPAFYERHQPLVLGDGTVVVQRVAARAGKGAGVGVGEEEGEEKFFDAVETMDTYELGEQVVAGVPLDGVGVTYPTLPQVEETTSLSPAPSELAPPTEEPIPAAEEATSEVADDATYEAADETTNKAADETRKEAATPTDSEVAKQPTKRPPPPSSPEVSLADTWVTSWRAALPAEYKLACGNATLRVYHLWHEQKFDIARVAALARDPPLAPVTVASYVLQAIKEEDLPYDVGSVGEALDLMPSSVLGRYRGIVEKVREKGA